MCFVVVRSVSRSVNKKRRRRVSSFPPPPPLQRVAPHLRLSPSGSIAGAGLHHTPAPSYPFSVHLGPKSQTPISIWRLVPNRRLYRRLYTTVHWTGFSQVPRMRFRLSAACGEYAANESWIAFQTCFFADLFRMSDRCMFRYILSHHALLRPRLPSVFFTGKSNKYAGQNATHKTSSHLPLKPFTVGRCFRPGFTGRCFHYT